MNYQYPKEEMIAMYRQMVLSRQYCKSIEKLCMQGRIIGMHHLGHGEEATGVAIRFAMRDDDWYIPQHRQHSGVIYKVDMHKWMSEKMGKVNGYAQGMACDLHGMVLDTHTLFINGIMGENYGIGTGFAHSLKLAGKGQVIVSCLGDGSFAEGIVYESLAMSVRFHEPIVFVVEDNGTANSYESSNFLKGFAALGDACSVVSTTVDGCDVLAARAAMETAIAGARKNVPHLVVFRNVRWGGHFVGDRQPQRDLEAMKNNDPIKRYEAVLYQQNLLNDEIRDEIWASTKAELDDAIAYAMPQEFPGPDIILDKSRMYVQPWEED